jgi:MFS transporter, FHS family, glucose/mannose:H+ symporter
MNLREGRVPSEEPVSSKQALPPFLLTGLYFGFVLTGIGTTLLGAALPVLSSSWGLNDSHSGFLLAAQFAGSSSGALLPQARLYRSLVQGYLLLLLGAVLIALSQGHFVAPFFFCFGLGMGLSMTATSMTIGRIYSASRGASLSLLNAFWGLGAVVCPPLVTIWGHFQPMILLYRVMAVCAAVPLVILCIGRGRLSGVQDDFAPSENLRARLLLLLPLGIFAFLYVGVESSVGSWMMTYIHRLPLASEIFAPAATSLFWMALFCGRTAVPVVLRYISESRLLTISLFFAVLSILLLLMSRTPVTSLTAAALAGLMLAPAFPLCISRVLSIASRPSESRWIFATSGLGGAVFPWMTGQIATDRSSLRAGLLIPLLACCAMLLLHLRTGSDTEK